MIDDLAPFLAERGITAESVEPLDGGCVNTNLQVTSTDGERFFLRRYDVTSVEAVAAELAAVRLLVSSGYPTAAPFGEPGFVDGRPVMLFDWIDGEIAPRERDIAIDIARLAGRLDRICEGRDFGPRRPPPPERLSAYLDRVEADAALMAVDGFSAWANDARRALAAWSDAASGVDVPTGFVHADLHEHNVLLETHTNRLMVVDFDDAYHGALLFDLVMVLWYWASDVCDDGVDRDDLIAAYEEERALTDGERALLPAARIVNAADEASGYLGGIEDDLRRGEAAVADCRSLAALRRLLDG